MSIKKLILSICVMVCLLFASCSSGNEITGSSVDNSGENNQKSADISGENNQNQEEKVTPKTGKTVMVSELIDSKSDRIWYANSYQFSATTFGKDVVVKNVYAFLDGKCYAVFLHDDFDPVTFRDIHFLTFGDVAKLSDQEIIDLIREKYPSQWKPRNYRIHQLTDPSGNSVIAEWIDIENDEGVFVEESYLSSRLIISNLHTVYQSTFCGFELKYKDNGYVYVVTKCPEDTELIFDKLGFNGCVVD